MDRQPGLISELQASKRPRLKKGRTSGGAQGKICEIDPVLYAQMGKCKEYYTANTKEWKGIMLKGVRDGPPTGISETDTTAAIRAV